MINRVDAPFLQQDPKLSEARPEPLQRISKRFSNDFRVSHNQTPEKRVSEHQLARTNPIESPNASLMEDFLGAEADPATLKDDYCRLWYEKLALEAANANLAQEGQRKDQLIAELRRELGRG